jgi:hypothetical protein
MDQNPPTTYDRACTIKKRWGKALTDGLDVDELRALRSLLDNNAPMWRAFHEVLFGLALAVATLGERAGVEQPQPTLKDYSDPLHLQFLDRLHQMLRARAAQGVPNFPVPGPRLTGAAATYRESIYPDKFAELLASYRARGGNGQ